MIAAKRLTAEEFALLPESQRAELIDGEVIQLMPTSRVHGRVVARFIAALEAWIQPSDYVGTETGVIVRRTPDRVRGPDIIYVRAEKMKAEDEMESGFWEIQPDLVAEVISKNETADEVRKKLSDYLAIGTGLVLLVFPETAEVEVHTPDGLARRYGSSDTLEFVAMPGFRLEVAKLLGIG